ncbi:hypothetical protein CVD28_22440 [Bacillus sp. M6-12]|uniref:hypothetical protein n=1 Tax=Bacillus sp. M6-12 TaxID=2054166 RepID=UPI000C75E383|nr:hypothetical protein [Bacillus sp. M6-12]PLS15477.1 hypothetical protein CVD28_22440 [Bacillus sp. M6-12]
MADAIVIGAYEFLGFHVSKHLLEDGLEVIGTTLDGSMGEEYEGKMLEIGRNANFCYQKQAEMLDSISENTVIYFFVYDYLKKGNNPTDVYAEIQKLAQKWKALQVKQPRILFFWPLNKDESGEQGSSMLEIYSNFEIMLDKWIFLPTIYGPWQPESMSFEAGIRGKSEHEVAQALNKEYTEDAVYITDFLNELKEILDSPEKRIIVKSLKKDQWINCAKQLFNEKQLSSVSTTCKNQIKREDISYILRNKTSPKEGIWIQREHRRLQDT